MLIDIPSSLQPCKRKGPNWPFTCSHFFLNFQWGIPTVAHSGRNTAVPSKWITSFYLATYLQVSHFSFPFATIIHKCAVDNKGVHFTAHEVIGKNLKRNGQETLRGDAKWELPGSILYLCRGWLFRIRRKGMGHILNWKHKGIASVHFINVFSRRKPVFHRWAKLFELNFFINNFTLK